MAFCQQLGCLLLLALGLSSQATAADAWQAGAAKTIITPDQPLWMAGYASRDKRATGKATELYAKALALRDPHGSECILVTLDLIGIDRDLAAAVSAGVNRAIGLSRERLAINCSHTHSGPVVARNLRPIHYFLLEDADKKLLDAYAAELEAKIVSVAKEAHDKLAPARIEWGLGKTTFAVNRRTNKEAEVVPLREKGLLKGPVDHDIPVLAVRSPAGELLAVTFGYACHATVLPFYEWSGDYPGYAQQALEAEFPSAVALFWAGCGGDQNPLPRRDVELAKKYGNQLATAVKEVLHAPLRPLSGELKSQYQAKSLAFERLPTKEEWETDAAGSNKYAAARAKFYLQELAAGREISASYPYPIQTWNLGSEIEWVFLGGEVVVDYALRIKAENRGSQTWVAGYSNDVMAYIPSRRVLTEGGYEGGGAMVFYGLPSVWSPQVEQTIIDEVTRQLRPGQSLQSTSDSR